MDESKDDQIRLTQKQVHWLDSRGGRNINDVKEDKNGLYAVFSDGYNKEKRVYIPTR